MTWIKLGDEFFDDCANAGLSDAAVRTHGEAIGWIYRVEQEDLRILKPLVRRFAGSDLRETAISELVAAKFWAEDRDSYVIVHHADVIRSSLAAQQIKRDRDKQYSRDYRKVASKKKVVTDVGNDVAADASNYVGKTQTDRQETPGLEEVKKTAPVLVTSGSPAGRQSGSSNGAAGSHPTCSTCGQDPGMFSLIGGQCRKCKFG